MTRVKAAVVAATITGATAAAMLVPSSPAVAFSSGGLVLDIHVQSPAHLIAKGAAIGVPVEYTCSGAASSPLALSVNVTERVSGGHVASGAGSLLTIVCTGEIESATVNVTASGNRAFTKGSAYAAGIIDGCTTDFVTCGAQDNSATITIKK